MFNLVPHMPLTSTKIVHQHECFSMNSYAERIFIDTLFLFTTYCFCKRRSGNYERATKHENVDGLQKTSACSYSHCAKSAQIRTRKYSVFGHFSRSVKMLKAHYERQRSI